jgi:hypothetical protein
LDASLGAYQPSRGDQLGFEQAFAQWVDKGVNSLRLLGVDGLESWLQEVDSRLKKYRKRCPPRVRAFINFFAYQAKTSFYLCYANFWIGLIPWLREHHGLDELSERFLRVWHNQNQPIALPPGRTASGIYYPTHGRATLLTQGSVPAGTARQVTWQTPRIGVDHVPDVFSGQVLALHPMAWYLFADSALRETTGRFFASSEFETIAAIENAASCSKYWNFIGAVLAAASKYRLARYQFENQRGVRVRAGRSVNAVQSDAATLDFNVVMDEFATARGWRCHCGAAYRCLDVALAAEVGGACRVTFECTACSHQASREVTEAEITRFLKVE